MGRVSLLLRLEIIAKGSPEFYQENRVDYCSQREINQNLINRYGFSLVTDSESRLNPILTGGGGVNLTPPCTKSVTASRPPLIATRFFMTFFFQVLRIFWYQVCENRTIGREVTQLFVLARRLKICPKSAFCICLCTKHMEITDFLKML